MATRKKYTTEDWDSRAVGASPEHAVAAPKSENDAVDAALGLRSIAIRLPVEMIDQYKLLAHFHGVGYQPLMRDVLARFVPQAMKELLEAQIKIAEQASTKTDFPALKKAA